MLKEKPRDLSDSNQKRDGVKASLVAQTVNNLPAMQETWVRSLGQEDSLENEMATHSSILTWMIPWPKELGGSQRIGYV